MRHRTQLVRAGPVGHVVDPQHRNARRPSRGRGTARPPRSPRAPHRARSAAARAAPAPGRHRPRPGPGARPPRDARPPSARWPAAAPPSPTNTADPGRRGRGRPPAGEPTCRTRPPASTATWSATDSASSWSWVTSTAVAPAACSAARTCRRDAPPAGRRRARRTARRAAPAPGRGASARASATRCCWPPDSSCGRRSAVAGQPDQLQHLVDPAAPRRAARASPKPTLPATDRCGNSAPSCGHDGDPAPCAAAAPRRRRRPAGRRAADRAGVGPLEAGDHAQQRGLAAAGRAEHRGQQLPAGTVRSTPRSTAVGRRSDLCSPSTPQHRSSGRATSGRPSVAVSSTRSGRRRAATSSAAYGAAAAYGRDAGVGPQLGGQRVHAGGAQQQGRRQFLHAVRNTSAAPAPIPGSASGRVTRRRRASRAARASGRPPPAPGRLRPPRPHRADRQRQEQRRVAPAPAAAPPGRRPGTTLMPKKTSDSADRRCPGSACPA